MIWKEISSSNFSTVANLRMVVGETQSSAYVFPIVSNLEVIRLRIIHRFKNDGVVRLNVVQAGVEARCVRVQMRRQDVRQSVTVLARKCQHVPISVSETTTPPGNKRRSVLALNKHAFPPKRSLRNIG